MGYIIKPNGEVNLSPDGKIQANADAIKELQDKILTHYNTRESLTIEATTVSLAKTDIDPECIENSILTSVEGNSYLITAIQGDVVYLYYVYTLQTGADITGTQQIDSYPSPVPGYTRNEIRTDISNGNISYFDVDVKNGVSIESTYTDGFNEDGDYTSTDVQVVLDSGIETSFNVLAKNGIAGVGIENIIEGNFTVDAGYTYTDVDVTKTDGAKDTFIVTAKNGVDGNGLVYEFATLAGQFISSENLYRYRLDTILDNRSDVKVEAEVYDNTASNSNAYIKMTGSTTQNFPLGSSALIKCNEITDYDNPSSYILYFEVFKKISTQGYGNIYDNMTAIRGSISTSAQSVYYYTAAPTISVSRFRYKPTA